MVESSRPLLSRSGCIYNPFESRFILNVVLVPFYRGAVVFITDETIETLETEVLVPFYRGAVVFIKALGLSFGEGVLVPFCRGAVVF